MKDDVTTTIRSPRALMDRLDVLARRNGGMRTQSDVIRWALTRGVETLEAELQVSPPLPVVSDLSSVLAELDALRARVAALSGPQQ